MKLDLRGLEPSGAAEEKVLSFNCGIDLSALKWWGEHPYPTPVRVWGEAVNRGDYYELRYTAECLHTFSCARCMKSVQLTKKLPFDHTVIETAEDPLDVDGYIPMSGGVLDLKQLVADDLLLGLGEPEYCEADCPGLCPVCGNRRGECDCPTEPPDPRFDSIRALLREESDNSGE